MSELFKPLTIRGLTIPNRIWMAPMCMYSAASAGESTGVATDFHIQHVASRAMGGVGLILIEATAVSEEGRISPNDLGLWNDRQSEAIGKMAAAIKTHGAVAGIQLAHAGRKASMTPPWAGDEPLSGEDGGWQTIAPSAEPFAGLPMPTEMSLEDIENTIAAFAAAAERALRAGIEVVEIHGAHGYLINSFMSPLSNKRTDRYGGSFENRIRFATEVADAVRAVWPEDLPVFFRVSATDWLAHVGGWTGDDTTRLAEHLKGSGVDLIDFSTGGIDPSARVRSSPGYQVPFAAATKAETGVKAGAVGLITDPHQAEEILSSGKADAVLLGRSLLRNPYWASHAAEQLGVPARRPIQYQHAVGGVPATRPAS